MSGKVARGTQEGAQRVIFNTVLGRRIRLFRERAGLNQMDLAKAAGYSSRGKK